MSDSKSKARKKTHRGLKALIVTAVVIVVILAGAVAALAVDDGNRTQRVPQTTILDGSVDVSGMTRDELDTTIRSRVKSGFSQTVKLELGGETQKISLSDVGKLDTTPTIEAAFAPYGTSAPERYLSRVKEIVTGRSETHQITTKLSPSSGKLKKRVRKLAAKVDRDARSAGYEYAGGKLVTTSSATGIEVDVDKTVDAVMQVLESDKGAQGKTVEVKGIANVTQPKVKSPGKAIFVDTSACKVYLYDNGKVTFSCLCSPGRAGYETPKGDFTLSYKVKDPTWENPHSDWSKNMPETIGPGPNNPMGLRKLAVSCGNGIFIHGTTNTGALGRPDSHGCMRVANANVVKLYDMVETGIPIIIR